LDSIFHELCDKPKELNVFAAPQNIFNII